MSPASSNCFKKRSAATPAKPMKTASMSFRSWPMYGPWSAVPSLGQSFCTTWPPASSNAFWKPATTSWPKAKSSAIVATFLKPSVFAA